MPLYEYECSGCGKEFEELVSRADEPVACPHCGAADARRKLSRFAFKSSGGKMKTSVGGSCSTCRPGPGGCSSCGG
jgi:putative FmdB family regulatory protein